jgi:FkbM family methyltransferase
VRAVPVLDFASATRLELRARELEAELDELRRWPRGGSVGGEAPNIGCQVSLARALNQPEYVFRPKQVLVRLRSGRRSATVTRDIVVQLPWRLELGVRTTDAVGHTVERTGVYDPAVSETLVRLTDTGDLAVDVGANVGYMTSLLALLVGGEGRVVCFEPQPDVCADLGANVLRWRRQGLAADIDVRCEAVSNTSGTGLFTRPPPGENRGGAFVPSTVASIPPEELQDVVFVRLDDVFDPQTVPIGMLKIDVERHELSVLQGSERLLARHAIRDIVFEENREYPNPVTELLEAHGYTLFKLDHTLLGPWIGEPHSRRWPIDDPSYLATGEPQRAVARLRRRGWGIFGHPWIHPRPRRAGRS